MSSPRSNYANILAILTQSNTTQNQPSHTTSNRVRLNVELVLKTMLLYLAWEIQNVRGMVQRVSEIADNAEIEALQMATDTWHRIVYPTDNPFPELPNRLAQDCNMIIGTPPANSTKYEIADNAQCIDGVGPNVDVYVEAGKNLSKSFMECFENILDDLCNRYYNPPSPPYTPPSPSPSSDFSTFYIFLSVVAGITVLAGVCCCICACTNRNSNRSNSTVETGPLITSRPHHHHHHSYSSRSSGASLVATTDLFSAFTSAESSASSSSTATGGYQGNSNSNNDSGSTYHHPTHHFHMNPH